MSDNVKFFLLKFYLGLIDHTEVISEVDKLINMDVWMDEFEYIYTRKALGEGKWISQLQDGAFRLSKNDFNHFESNFYPVLMSKVLNLQVQSIEIIEILYKYFMLKIKILDLSSNDISERWYSIINDYELRRDGFSGVLRLPEDLLDILKIELNN